MCIRDSINYITSHDAHSTGTTLVVICFWMAVLFHHHRDATCKKKQILYIFIICTTRKKLTYFIGQNLVRQKVTFVQKNAYFSLKNPFFILDLFFVEINYSSDKNLSHFHKISSLLSDNLNEYQFLTATFLLTVLMVCERRLRSQNRCFQSHHRRSS